MLVTVLVTVDVGFAVLVAVTVALEVAGLVEEVTATGVKMSSGGFAASRLCIFLAEEAEVVRTKA